MHLPLLAEIARPHPFLDSGELLCLHLQTLVSLFHQAVKSVCQLSLPSRLVLELHRLN